MAAFYDVWVGTSALEGAEEKQLDELSILIYYMTMIGATWTTA